MPTSTPSETPTIANVQEGSERGVTDLGDNDDDDGVNGALVGTLVGLGVGLCCCLLVLLPVAWSRAQASREGPESGAFLV